MAKLETLEGVGVLFLAVLFNAVFALQVITPRAAAAPGIVAVHPTITVSVGR